MSTGKPRNWLITGASGFIGRELVFSLLTHTTDHITLLLRSGVHHRSPRDRITELMRSFDSAFVLDESRLDVHDLDVTQLASDITPFALSALYEFNNLFIHLAANTAFDANMHDAQTVNIGGTREALALAKNLNDKQALQTFAYVSTAYVHGDQSGVVTADQALCSISLRNVYEKTKCSAELEVRSNMKALPVMIFRPSIVVGDSVTGRASGNSTVYWALKRYARGHRRFFANPHARLDIVPVDYVVAALVRLVPDMRNLGRCFPLVAGHHNDITLQELAQAASCYYGMKSPILRSPEKLLALGRLIGKVSLSEQLFFQQMIAYLPYFSNNPRFDATNTDAALEGSGIQRPVFNEFANALFKHCDKRSVSASAASAQQDQLESEA